MIQKNTNGGCLNGTALSVPPPAQSDRMTSKQEKPLANVQQTSAETPETTPRKPIDAQCRMLLGKTALSYSEILISPRPIWLVEGAIAQGNVGFLNGLPGHGKTVLAASLTAACLSGGQWFGRKCSSPSKVIFFAGESDTFTKARFQAAFEAYGVPEEVREEKFLYVEGVPSISTLNTDLSKKDELECTGALIIIDNLVLAANGANISDGTVATQLVAELRKAAVRLKATIMTLHHEPKKASGPTKHGIGSIFLETNPDFVFRVDGRGKTKTVSSVKERNAERNFGGDFHLETVDAMMIDDNAGKYILQVPKVVWPDPNELSELEAAALAIVEEVLKTDSQSASKGVTSGVFEKINKEDLDWAALERQHSSEILDNLLKLKNNLGKAVLQALARRGLLNMTGGGKNKTAYFKLPPKEPSDREEDAISEFQSP